jgi:uncharacterized protein (TIGR02452 family)
MEPVLIKTNNKSFDFAFTPSRGPSRNECQRLGKEIMAIVGRGAYKAPGADGKTIKIDDLVKSAKERTVEYEPDAKVGAPINPRGTFKSTKVRVVNGTSLAVGRAMVKGSESDVRPFVLNFASAKNPGGGFQMGARAQEESLARSSALYACIEGRNMYFMHRNFADCMYTNAMIYSPDVIVMRDDESGELLSDPWFANFLTAPAPNAKVVLERDPSRKDEVNEVMRARVTRSLATAAAHGNTHLVLGAWGCGVFGNDPKVVADAYHHDLTNDFEGVFEEVAFAVLDWSEDRHFIRPFVERFAS